MVEKTYSNKENNGGIPIDMNNNLYLANVETHSVGFVSADKKLSVNNVQWSDGVSYNKDDLYVYFSLEEIPLGVDFNAGTDLTKKLFIIYRFKPVGEGVFEDKQNFN